MMRLSLIGKLLVYIHIYIYIQYWPSLQDLHMPFKKTSTIIYFSFDIFCVQTIGLTLLQPHPETLVLSFITGKVLLFCVIAPFFECVKKYVSESSKLMKSICFIFAFVKYALALLDSFQKHPRLFSVNIL